MMDKRVEFNLSCKGISLNFVKISKQKQFCWSGSQCIYPSSVLNKFYNFVYGMSLILMEQAEIICDNFSQQLFIALLYIGG